MQAESKFRHLGRTSLFDIKPTVKEVVIEVPKTLSQLIDESYEFRDGRLNLKKQQRKKKEKIILPDLMAAQIPLSCTSDKKEDPVIKKQEVMGTSTKVWDSMFNKPHVPKPVQEKKIIFKSPGIIPDPPKQLWERPKAVYSNSSSPYGIYDELKEEWNKKTG